MSRQLAATLLLSFCVSVSACGSPENESKDSGLVVVLDADPALEAKLDRIEVLTSSSQLDTLWLRAAPPGEKTVKLPFSFVVRGAVGREGTLQVRGFAGESERVRHSAIVKIERSGLKRWAIYLSERCEARFRECDAPSNGAETCEPCTGLCRNAELDWAALPSVASESAALASWRGLQCDGSRDDAGSRDAGGNGPDDAGMDSSVGDAGSDAGMDAMVIVDPQAEAGVDAGGEAGTIDAGPPPLSLEAPAVVAMGRCVKLVLRRGDASLATNGATLTPSVGLLYASSDCTGSSITQLDFIGTSLEATLYYLAPANLGGQLTGEAVITAAVPLLVDQARLELRVPAVRAGRGAGFGCVLRADHTLSCFGESMAGAMGVSWDDLDFTIQPTPARPSTMSPMTDDALLSSAGGSLCALEGGGMRCLGSNSYGQLGTGNSEDRYAPVVPTGLGSDVRQIDLGSSHACAVRESDRAVFCFGSNYNYRSGSSDPDVALKIPTKLVQLSSPTLTGPDDPNAVEECATGSYFTCVRTRGGAISCTGFDSGGFAAIDLLANSPALEGKVTGMFAVGTQICLKTSDNTLYCGDFAARSFSQVGLPAGTLGLVAGAELDNEKLVTCAQVGGSLYCWGTNTQGWLGTGSPLATIPASAPGKVALPSATLESFDVGSVSGSGVALTAVIDGVAYSWGYTGAGTTGIDNSLGLQAVPVAMPQLDALDPTRVETAEGDATCALADGKVCCWGSGTAIGNGKSTISTGAFTDDCTPLSGFGTGAGSEVVELELGEDLGFARQANGKVMVWGDNTFGVLGVGAEGGQYASPVHATAVEALSSDVEQLASSTRTACARLASGAIVCWGGWQDVAVTSPVEIDFGFTDGGAAVASDVSVGDQRACAVVEGAAWCWTSLTNAAVVPGFETNVSAVALESNMTCVVKSDIAYCARGALPDTTNQTFGVQTVTRLEAASFHVCAVLTSGDLQCWGDNQWGELGRGNLAPAGAGPVLDVENAVPSSLVASNYGSCVKGSDGWVCWGNNQNDSFDLIPSVITTPTPIAAWPDVE